MRFVNYHATQNIKKVIEASEKLKKNGIKTLIKETQEDNNCVYLFADGFEYSGKKLGTDTVKAYKENHGKLKICVIR